MLWNLSRPFNNNYVSSKEPIWMEYFWVHNRNISNTFSNCHMFDYFKVQFPNFFVFSIIPNNHEHFTYISPSACNGTRTHTHLVRKRTLNHLVKWSSVTLQTKWLRVRVPLQSLKLQISRLFRARSSLPFRQL